MTAEALITAAVLTMGTLRWPQANGAWRYRVYACPVNACATHPHDVNGTIKPFPTDLGEWVLMREVAKRTRSLSVACGYDYSVQAIAKDGRASAGGNVVSCP